MATTAPVGRHSRDPPLPVEVPRPSSPTCAGASPRRAGPPGSSSRIGRRACSWRRCRSSPATGRPIRLAQGRGEAERATAVHDRDRRGGHPLHPRRSPHENALPLIMTHGWPGSVIELLETIGPLTDPTAHGGTRRGRLPPGAAVLARLRLLGRADRARLGPRPHRAGLGGADEPPRLHPLCRPGRRRGRPRHRRDGPPGARGAARHPHELARDGAGRPPAGGVRAGTRGARRAQHVQDDGFGYFLEMATRPQTIGYALLDSPVGLAAWMLDHDTDSYYKISRAFVDGEPVGNLTRDHILDNITLYWLTGTGASAARSYWEDGRALASTASGQAPPGSRSRSASPPSPARSGGPRAAGSRTSYPNLTYFNEVDRGGHFAAWEEPELFSDEVRAAFRSLR